MFLTNVQCTFSTVDIRFPHFLVQFEKKLGLLLQNIYSLNTRFIAAVNLGLKMENTACIIRVLKSPFYCLVHVFGYSVASIC